MDPKNYSVLSSGTVPYLGELGVNARSEELIAPNSSSGDVISDINHHDEIEKLLSKVQILIDTHKLEAMSGLGIKDVQKGYQEITARIYKIKTEQRIADEELIALTENINAISNYTLVEMFDENKQIEGLTEICEIYKQIRLLFDNELLVIARFVEKKNGSFLPDRSSSPFQAKNSNQNSNIQTTLNIQNSNIPAAVVLPATAQTTPKKFILESATEENKNNKSIVLSAVMKNGLELGFAAKFKMDREIVLAAVTQNGLALQFASKDLQNDKEIVFAAIRQNGSAFRYADDRLTCDRQFVLDSVATNGLVLEYVNYTFRGNRDIVLAAVTQNGLALKYCAEEMLRDYKLIITAVTQNGLALQFASKEMRKDRDLCLTAVTQNGLALEFVDEILKGDKHLVLSAIKQNSKAIDFAERKLRTDEEILKAVAQIMGRFGLTNTPSAENSNEFNRIAELQAQREDEALEVLSRIAAVDQVMRGTVALIGEIFDAQIVLVTKLLNQSQESRDFDSANRELQVTISEIRQTQFLDYQSLINQRETIVEDGKEVPLTSAKKEELLRTWGETIEKVIDELGQLNLTEQTNIEHLLNHLKEQRKEKFESYNEMMEGKTSLTNRLFQLQKEANRLFQIRCRWLHAEASDIWSASSAGNLEVLRTCIGKLWIWQKSDGVNKLNRQGFAPIHLAAFNNQIEALRFLLDNKGNSCLNDSHGYQPLHWAAKKGFCPIVQVLLNSRAAINAPGEYGRTPLHMSVYNGKLECTQLLLDRGANINAQTSPDDASKTPLHDAVILGNLPMVRLLLKNPNLNVMTRDRMGLTPLAHAVMDGHVEIASLLVAHASWRAIRDPQDPNHRNNLLQLRVRQNQEEMRGFLRTLAE